MTAILEEMQVGSRALVALTERLDGIVAHGVQVHL